MKHTDASGSGGSYLQYVGICGATPECADAVERLLLTRVDLSSAVILTVPNPAHAEHAMLLTTELGDRIIVKSGFASGYGGTGPRGLSATIVLLHWHGVSLDEILISPEMLRRLDASALTAADLASLEAQPKLRPARLWDYIHPDDMVQHDANPWARRTPILPWPLIDDELAEIARGFWDDPDMALMKAHRQLETRVRERAEITLEEASKGPMETFKLAFNAPNARLCWPGITSSEHIGRANLFFGALQAYRHVRSHRVLKLDPHEALGELLIFNQLFRLLRSAERRTEVCAT
jgi:hypothetical protein